MQFQRTHGNQRAMPISMILKTRSWVFRLLRSTLKEENRLEPVSLTIFLVGGSTNSTRLCTELSLILRPTSATEKSLKTDFENLNFVPRRLNSLSSCFCSAFREKLTNECSEFIVLWNACSSIQSSLYDTLSLTLSLSHTHTHPRTLFFWVGKEFEQLKIR